MLTCRRCGTGSLIPPHASSRSPGQEEPGRPVWRWSSRARSRQRAQPVCCSSPLAAVRNPAFVAPAIAEALGLSDVTALDLPRRARAACDGQPTLLVLDNFEQVLDAAPLVADLLTSVAALRVLVTSRAPLRVRGEREYAVGPLALDVDVGRDVARRSRALSRGAALRGAGSGRATRLSPHVRERPHRDGDLSAARCPAARARARGPVDQSADGRGSAPPTRRTMSCSRPSARAISPNANRR